MNKLFTLAAAAVMSASAFTAMGQDAVTVLEPSGQYVSNASYIKLAWDYDETTGKGAELTFANKSLWFTLNYNGKGYDFRTSTGGNPSIVDNVLVIDIKKIDGLENAGEGTYFLTVPKGVVTYGPDSKKNDDFTFPFEVVGNMSGSPEVTPSSGTVTSKEISGAMISIAYSEEYSELQVNESAGDITVTYTNSGVDPQTTVIGKGQYNLAGNVLGFQLKSDIPDNSTIEVTVPSNFIIAKNPEGKTVVGGGVNLNYRVWDGLPEATFIQEMATEVARIDPVKVTWGYLPLTVVNNKLVLDFYFYDRNTDQFNTVDFYPNFSLENGPEGQENAVLVVDVSNVLDFCEANKYAPTWYTFYLPEGVVKSGDRINPFQKPFISFNLADVIARVPATAYDPETQIFSLYWDDGMTNFGSRNYNIKAQAYLKSTVDGSAIYVNDLTESKDLEVYGGYFYYLDLANYELTDPTQYELVVPWGYFKINYRENTSTDTWDQAANIQWELPIKTQGGYEDENGPSSGIEGIVVPNSETIFYDITGRRVLNPVKGQMIIVVKDGKSSKAIF